MSNSRFGLRTLEGNVTGILDNISFNFPLLDAFPNAAVAYSLRKLRTAYGGSAIRVRRSNDNAEQDIGFVNEFLDTASLLAFVGVNSGFVTTWYDQSGLNVDIVQTTSANQPRIVNSGVLDTDGGLPCIVFDGTNDNLQAATATFNTYISAYVVCKTTLAKPFFIEHSANAFNTDGFWFYGTSANAWNFNRTGTHGASGVTNWAGTTKILATLIYNAAAQNYFKNSLLQSNVGFIGTLRPNTAITSSFNVFSRNGTTSFADGILQELIIYNDTTATNITNIENNIKKYYNVY
jgi:hypothetical protein